MITKQEILNIINGDNKEYAEHTIINKGERLYYIICWDNAKGDERELVSRYSYVKKEHEGNVISIYEYSNDDIGKLETIANNKNMETVDRILDVIHEEINIIKQKIGETEKQLMQIKNGGGCNDK